jgi:hypothetical protein
MRLCRRSWIHTIESLGYYSFSWIGSRTRRNDCIYDEMTIFFGLIVMRAEFGLAYGVPDLMRNAVGWAKGWLRFSFM